jgi:hypothetical protein
MTTFHTPDGEYPEYTRFPRQSTPCGIVWVSLEVEPNRVRKYALCNITEVIDPRLTGMVYGCEEPYELRGLGESAINHWLDVQQARIEWNWKHVYIPADMLGKYRIGKEGADAEMSIGVRLCPLWKPKTVISVFAESMRPAA